MGSEIVFLFGPIGLVALVYLGYLASKPELRLTSILCLLLSALFSILTVTVVPSYSFWTQAGFFGFVFVLTAAVTFPALLVVFKLIMRRSES